MFEEAVAANGRTETASSLAASFLLHALLATAVMSWWTVAPPPLLEETVPVTLMTPAEFDALSGAAPPPLARPPPLPPPVGNVPDTAAPMTHASTILSGRALAEPRNRKAREALPHLNPTERMVQLCNVEALEQVARARHDFAPETVSAYAMKPLAIGRDTVEANGAAVRSGDDWYGLSYRCRLSPGHEAVTAFDFLAGDRLTPERVAELGLPVGQ